MPIFILVAMVAGCKLRKKQWFRTRVLPLYVIVIALLGVGLLSPVANHFRYALPWRLPTHVRYLGRDFNMSAVGCRSGGEREPTSPKQGWVFGYFATAKEIYADPPTALAKVPTSLVVRRDGGRLMLYELSGGP